MKYLCLFLAVSTLIACCTSAEHPHGKPIHILSSFEIPENETLIYEPHYQKIGDFFKLDPEILERKVMVFSIVGAYRTGKSFFLDYCLRYLYANYKSVATRETWKEPQKNWLGSPTEPLSGFTWKFGRKANTNGILLWNDIFLYDSPSGDKIAIILMDTQGLFDPYLKSDLSSRIFGLSTLISSVIVVNTNGLIHKNDLQFLEMSTQFTKLIQSGKDLKAQKKPFQNMMFLFRDWIDEEIGYGYEGGAKYYKELVNAPGSKTTFDNIEEPFDKFSMFLLGHPGPKVAKLEFDGSYGNLDEKFIPQLKKLIESIFAPEKLILKNYLGRHVTLDELRKYFLNFIQLFSAPDLPIVDNVYEAFVHKIVETFCDKLVKKFSRMIKANLDFTVTNFIIKYEAHKKKVKEEIFELFRNSELIKDDRIKEENVKKLHDRLIEVEEPFTKDVYSKYDYFKAELEDIQKLKLKVDEHEIKVAKLSEKVNAMHAEEAEKLFNEILEKQRKRELMWYVGGTLVVGVGVGIAGAAYFGTTAAFKTAVTLAPVIKDTACKIENYFSILRFC